MKLLIERHDGVWYIEAGEHGFSYSLWFVVGLCKAIWRAWRHSTSTTARRR